MSLLYKKRFLKERIKKVLAKRVKKVYINTSAEIKKSDKRCKVTNI